MRGDTTSGLAGLWTPTGKPYFFVVEDVQPLAPIDRRRNGLATAVAAVRFIVITAGAKPARWVLNKF